MSRYRSSVSALPRPMQIGAALSALALSLCAWLGTTYLVACAENVAEVRAPERPVFPYDERGAELFDDRIEPAAVGYAAANVASPGDDAILRDRVQTADAVVRARVETVTSGAADGVWLVGLHVVEKLAGAHPPLPDFTLQVSPTHGESGTLHALEGQSVGTTILVFVSDFAGALGRRETHFHISPDKKPQVDAVRAAVLLGEVH